MRADIVVAGEEPYQQRWTSSSVQFAASVCFKFRHACPLHAFRIWRSAGGSSACRGSRAQPPNTSKSLRWGRISAICQHSPFSKRGGDRWVAFTPGHDAQRIRASVERREIKGIYHYTAITNLPSIIREEGLLSRAEMDARGIVYVGHGWGRPGKEQELEDYVCCSFVPHWGMLRKETEPQGVLELSPDLIWRKGTIFCPDNSASNEFNLDMLRDNNTVETFDAMFNSPDISFPTPYQCEVLGYREISLKHLRAIHFRTTEEKDYASTLIRDVLQDPHLRQRLNPILPIRVGVTPRLYPPEMRA